MAERLGTSNVGQAKRLKEPRKTAALARRMMKERLPVLMAMHIKVIDQMIFDAIQKLSGRIIIPEHMLENKVLKEKLLKHYTKLGYCIMPTSRTVMIVWSADD